MPIQYDFQTFPELNCNIHYTKTLLPQIMKSFTCDTYDSKI